ncbi:uncharacterized protein LOC128958137 [Oppia nitens]|uniref:uncharacterized protein LOC128958137 n=1 Tax=Oppia nitens TaxID=1686743 RepID=UPI0023DA827C|nr:uncharacterized protein LOC128958137 [Oppia nitens]
MSYNRPNRSRGRGQRDSRRSQNLERLEQHGPPLYMAEGIPTLLEQRDQMIALQGPPLYMAEGFPTFQEQGIPASHPSGGPSSFGYQIPNYPQTGAFTSQPPLGSAMTALGGHPPIDTTLAGYASQTLSQRDGYGLLRPQPDYAAQERLRYGYQPTHVVPPHSTYQSPWAPTVGQQYSYEEVQPPPPEWSEPSIRQFAPRPRAWTPPQRESPSPDIDWGERFLEGGTNQRIPSPRPRAWAPRPRESAPRPRTWAPRPREPAPRPRAWAPRPRTWAPRSRAWAPRPRTWAPRSRAWAPRSRAWAPRSRAWAPRSRAWAPRSRAWAPRSRAWAPPQRESPSPDIDWGERFLEGGTNQRIPSPENELPIIDVEPIGQQQQQPGRHRPINEVWPTPTTRPIRPSDPMQTIPEETDSQ